MGADILSGSGLALNRIRVLLESEEGGSFSIPALHKVSNVVVSVGDTKRLGRRNEKEKEPPPL
jgi:hypothetical protein